MGWGQDWGTALYGDPGAPLLDYIEGFEHQTLSTTQFGGSGAGIWDTVNTSGAFSFVAGRNGLALHIVESGAAVVDAVKFVPLSRTRVFSGYFRAAAAPVAASWIWVLNDAAGNLLARLRLEVDGTMTVASADGAVRGTGNVCDNVWHLIDIVVDTSCTTLDSATWVVEWQLDGVAGTTATSVTGKIATDSRRLIYGSTVSTHNATVDWDDCVSSASVGTFPIGMHNVGSMVPTSDGTHAAGTNVIEANGGVDIGVTPAFSLMDEWPANTTDFVQQAVTGASNYAEVNFSDTTVSVVWGAVAIAALRSAATTANTGTTRIVDATNTSVIDVYSGDMSETALHYRTVILPVPSGGWTPTFLNGLKARVGFSTDATPDPQWSALMLQYAVEEVEVHEVDLPLISRVPTVFVETHLFNPKATLGLISRVGVLFNPKLRITILLPFISRTSQTFAPTQYTQKVVDAGAFEQGAFDDDTFQHGTSFYISSQVRLFAPEFPANPQTVTLGVDSAFQDDAFQDNAFQDSSSIGGSIIRTGAAFAPQVTGQAVSAFVYLTGTGGWDSGDVTWDETTTDWDTAGFGGLINQSGHVFTPQLQFTKILLGLIDRTPVLFAPSPGASSFGPIPLISRVGFPFTPQKVNESITVGLISNVGVALTPVVSAPQEVDLDLIDNSPVLFEFQLNTQQMELPFINSAGFTYTPQQVTQTVVVDLIASTVSVFAPKLDAIALGLIVNTPTVFEPVNVVFNAPDVELDLIDQTPVVFAPPLFLIPFQQTIRLDETAEQFIDNAGHVFQFVSVELALPQSVVVWFIDQTGVALVLRVFLPTRPTIVLHARYDPITVLHARYVPVILKHAQDTRQG